VTAAKSLFGLETELGFAAVDANGQKADSIRVLDLLLKLAAQRLSHLPGGGSRLFLRNGSLIYIDCGLHPELATPECSSPDDLVRYVRAGEHIMTELTRELEQRDDLSQVRAFKSNVDFCDASVTWGCHESYLCRSDIDLLSRHLLPHFVSRIVYTGSGGLNSGSRGIDFSISPRVQHLVKISSGASTQSRGIFHTKNEPLCGHGYRRLHVLCGDSANSELATWLKVGATALITALIDKGYQPGTAMALREPLAAMQRFALDASCKTKAETVDKHRFVTAIDIQRHYLAEVEARLGEGFLPDWAEHVCQIWRNVLDILESDPTRLAATLDWSIKLALFQKRAKRRDVPWNTVPVWSGVVNSIDRLIRTSRRKVRDTIDLALVTRLRRGRGATPDAVDEQTRVLASHDLTWDGLDAFNALRLELWELDLRFGELGPRGIFADLDARGLLRHHMLAPDDWRHAVDHPPADTRARVRGDCVARWNENRHEYNCGWSLIRGPGGFVNLSDPFETTIRWQDNSHATPVEEDLLLGLRPP
jgi:proteasome accessory factor A